MEQATHARLAPVAPPFDADLQRTLERMMGGTGVEPLALFRTVAHNPQVLDKFRSVGTYLLNFGTVDSLEREIVIHRTCARCGSEYEWGVHVEIYGRSLGLSDAQITATVIGDADNAVWSHRQSLLIRLVDELHDTNDVSDGLWSALAAIWEPAQLVELVALVGQYHLVSFFTRAFRVDLEAYGARFQPRDP